MQISVESGEGLERRMKVGLEPEQVDAEVEKRLRTLARSVRMPGFRPGKVPVKLMRRRYGEQVLQEVFGELVQSSFPEAAEKEALRPVGPPQIEPDIDESANHYAYTAVFEVLPRIELAPLDGRSIERPVAEVTDADLEKMLEQMRIQRRTWKRVERPAQSGDRLTISYKGTLDGEPFEGGSADNFEIELGLGLMIPGFEDALMGVQAGEERRLDLRFPDNHPREHLKGKPVVFDVHVKEIAEALLPEIDADFAKAFGVEDGDLARFRADVRRDMERALKERIDAKIKGQVMDLLLETNPIEIPEVLVAKEIEALKQNVRAETGGGNFELPDHLFRDQARRRVALGLVFAAVVDANDIQVDAQGVRESVEELASTYEQPQQLIDRFYGNKEQLASMESLNLENQVVGWVLERVTLVDEPVTFEEMTGLEAGG